MESEVPVDGQAPKSSNGRNSDWRLLAVVVPVILVVLFGIDRATEAWEQRREAADRERDAEFAVDAYLELRRGVGPPGGHAVVLCTTDGDVRGLFLFCHADQPLDFVDRDTPEFGPEAAARPLGDDVDPEHAFEVSVQRRTFSTLVRLDGELIAFPEENDLLVIQRPGGGYERFELDLADYGLTAGEDVDEIERARPLPRALEEHAFAVWGEIGEWGPFHERRWDSLEAYRAGEPPSVEGHR